MQLIQALILAVTQGATELFPISSVGHGVIIPYLLHWTYNRQALLPFMVMLHLGTAFALLIYFRRDWYDFLLSIFGARRTDGRRLLTMVIIGTIPAAVIGFVFEKKFRALFPDARSASFFLIVNGLFLLVGEWLRGRGHKSLDRLKPVQALVIGVLQSLALVPGFSRSGVTMVGGLIYGYTYEAAARFAFLLATPIILGAGVLEVPKMLKYGHSQMAIATLGGLVAGVVAYLSVVFLMRYFKRREVEALRPFAYYCLLVGLAVFVRTVF
ncbi:MAG: undecaprenyl-diphosphate phosphatase [Peptococcaceae bacterium]|jgi:undecaprenyl-diphosphatase|nr:undecaprenyl-diphosphate phosphatase [Peptococcaceae bacterium]